jgi:hypothetical protein
MKHPSSLSIEAAHEAQKLSATAAQAHILPAQPIGKVGRRQYLWLFAALLVGLSVRIPGVLWGYNFPFGWYGHHVDEYAHLVLAETLINPLATPRWPPHPYPKGLAAHVAVPVLAVGAARGKLLVTSREQLAKPPDVRTIITAGRLVSVFYGTATILMVFLMARLVFPDVRTSLLAAWLVALGGLHVTQSHFFVADVPSIFWLLLGLYMLFRHLQVSDARQLHFLSAAAFCFGVAFGVKLVVAGLPTLVVLAFMRPPRLMRAVYCAVFFFTGLVLINLLSFTPIDIYKTFVRGISDPYQFSRVWSLLLYFIELPSVVSFPVLLMALVGTFFLVRDLVRLKGDPQFMAISLVMVLPALVQAYLILFKMDHFPRHLIGLVPWIAMAAAWGLSEVGRALEQRGISPAVAVVPVVAWLALFVYDGERVFIQEPRNQAARWLQQNVSPDTPISWWKHDWIANYRHVDFPEEGRPPVVVVEMHTANHFLSGVGLKNTFPRDYRRVFASRSQSRLDAIQALFKGTSEYKEVARFSEGYFMPEFILAERWIGDRSRNYVTEIVIFRRAAEHEGPLPVPDLKLSQP